MGVREGEREGGREGERVGGGGGGRGEGREGGWVRGREGERDEVHSDAVQQLDLSCAAAKLVSGYKVVLEGEEGTSGLCFSSDC